MEHTLGAASVATTATSRSVLILVLVEHTLGGPAIYVNLLPAVLILVLVEHTLGVAAALATIAAANVLILVLVEHTLGGVQDI